METGHSASVRSQRVLTEYKLDGASRIRAPNIETYLPSEQ